MIYSSNYITSTHFLSALHWPQTVSLSLHYRPSEATSGKKRERKEGREWREGWAKKGKEGERKEEGIKGDIKGKEREKRKPFICICDIYGINTPKRAMAISSYQCDVTECRLGYTISSQKGQGHLPSVSCSSVFIFLYH